MDIIGAVIAGTIFILLTIFIIAFITSIGLTAFIGWCLVFGGIGFGLWSLLYL